MKSISIITVAYNAEETIADCIECVADQTIDVEHIVIDGASTDGTLEILEQHRDHLAMVVSEPDQGVYDAMNKGIELATADIVGILNADDYYPSRKTLEKVSEALSDTEVQACYGDLVYVDRVKKDKVIRYWRSGDFDRNKFYWGWMPPHPTFFIRRPFYKQCGLFNPKLGSAADYEIMLRLLLKCRLQAKYIPEVLVHMRAGGVSNASLLNRITANRMDREAWNINGLKPYPWTLWIKPIRKIGQWFFKPAHRED